jgi:excisionase family DNA binding protein
LLTLDEAARLLGVQLQTLRAYIRCAEVPAFRVGDRAIRIRRDDFAALLVRQRPVSARTDPASEPPDTRSTGKGELE